MLLGFGILGHAQNLASNQTNEVSFVIHNLPIIAKMASVAKACGNMFQLLQNCANRLDQFYHESNLSNRLTENSQANKVMSFDNSSYYSKSQEGEKEKQSVSQTNQIKVPPNLIKKKSDT